MPLFYFRDPFKDPFWTRDVFLAPLGDIFETTLNLEHFKPEEISIKLNDDNLVIVEAKHEEKKDQDGAVSRHLVKKFWVPKGYDVGKIQSRLYSDGVLVISCPKIQKSESEKGRDIPVMRVKSKL